jgi:hypothetical protein
MMYNDKNRLFGKLLKFSQPGFIPFEIPPVVIPRERTLSSFFFSRCQRNRRSEASLAEKNATT